MYRTAARPIALALGFAVAAAAIPTARASSVPLSSVTPSAYVSRDGQVRTILRLPAVVSDGVTTSNFHSVSSVVSANRMTANQNLSVQDGAPATSNGGATSTQSGVTFDDGAQSVQTVQQVQVGDVTGTICDCGEIAVPPAAAAGGGFPKYLLFALGALPLLFLGGDSNTSSTTSSLPIITTPTVPTPTPTPTAPPPAAVPEPATMLLLGTGLAALGARRRRRVGVEATLAQTARDKEVQS